MLLMRQGEQAWLLTSDGGNHEFARIFYIEGRYRLRDGNGRLGPYELLHAAIDERGAHLTWTKGRKSFIPRDWFQLTWS